MEALISAVLGDILSRAVSVLVKKCHEQMTAKDQNHTEEDLQRLQQLLLRISAVVEEAEGRYVTNRGMIRQVRLMTEQMFRGYFLLDAFRCGEKKTEDKEVSLAQSKFNPAKRFRLISSNTQTESIIIGGDSSKKLKQVILVLENMFADMKEFAIFLMSYPRIYRQPYGAYLYLDKYMFGRQVEREQAISFLLHTEPPGNGNFGVLPIIGPTFVGKSTLVEHVCNDERVRNHFSLILLYNGNDLKDETATTFRDHCVTKHQNIALDEGRSLIIIELLGDVDKGAWKRLLHTCERSMAHGSKIIITSRSEKMVSVGTTVTIKLNRLSKEAYWYFFKMLVFGSTDPEERPKLTFIAMEIAIELRGSFIAAYIVAALLRANFSDRSWCRVLRLVKEYMQNNTLAFGENPEDMSHYISTMAETLQGSEDQEVFLIHNCHQKGPAAQGEVPRITLLDLISGSVMPRGKFELLTWRSLIPPYYSYIYACEFVRHKSTMP